MIAGLLFIGSTAAFFAQDVQAANFEVFMLPTMVAAFVLAVRDRPLASGVAIAVSTLTKQTAAVTLLPLAWLVWTRRPDRRADRARGLALLAAGFLVPVLIVAVAFGWHDFTHWVFTSNDGYLDANGVLGYALHRGLVQTTWFVLANVAIVGLCVAAARRWRADADLWLWVIAGLIAVASGLRFFGHYYLQLLPPLSLLATRPLARRRHGPWRRSRWRSWYPSRTWRCLRTSATTHRPSGPGERSRRTRGRTRRPGPTSSCGDTYPRSTGGRTGPRRRASRPRASSPA